MHKSGKPITLQVRTGKKYSQVLYAWLDSYQLKHDAIAQAARLRKSGSQARVIQDTFGWGVYYRPKTGWRQPGFMGIYRGK